MCIRDRSYVIKAKDIVLMKTTPQPKAQGDNTSKIVKGVVVDAENNEPIIDVYKRQSL